MRILKIIRDYNIKLSKPEITVLLTLVILGTFTTLATPFSAGFDEETHLIRVWQISAFVFIPNQKVGNQLPYPAIYHDLSYRRDAIIQTADPDFWSKYGDLPLDAHDYIYSPKTTRSVYSPILLLPQALVMRYLGRAWDFPAMVVFYACRIVGLVCYIILVLISIRLIPYGKWLLAVIAISPMAIFQAATITTDTISNGIGFLFVSGCLALANRKEISFKGLISLLGLIGLLFTAKINFAFLVLLPFIFFGPKSFTTKRGYLILVTATLVLASLEVVGWSIIGYTNYDMALEGASPIGQIQFMFSHPLQFIKIFLLDLLNHGFDYLKGWIGVYGYGYWSVPKVTYYLYFCAAIASIFLHEDEIVPSRRIRSGLIAVFILGSIATIVLMYITYTPVGNLSIAGVQGRYFIPFMPLLLLGITNLNLFSYRKIPIWLVYTLALSSLASYLIGLYLSYHVLCGTTYYETGFCYQPYYKNWAPDELYSPPISDQMSLSQEIIVHCNGVSQLRLWSNASEMKDEETVLFALQDMNDKTTVIEQEVSKSEIPDGGWYALDFPPDWTSEGKFYFLTIQPGNDSDGPGPKFAYTLKHDYLDGKLYENDTIISTDLVFQYGCITGIKKVLSELSP